MTITTKSPRRPKKIETFDLASAGSVSGEVLVGVRVVLRAMIAMVLPLQV